RGARYQTVAVVDQGPAFGREREAADLVDLLLGQAAEVFLDQIVPAEEERRSVTDRGRCVAALEAVAERVVDVREIREVSDVGAAGAKGLVVASLPCPVAPRPSGTQV